MRRWLPRQHSSFVEICAHVRMMGVRWRCGRDLTNADVCLTEYPKHVVALTFFSSRSACVLQFMQLAAKFFTPSKLLWATAVSLVLHPAMMDGFVSTFLCHFFECLKRSIIPLLSVGISTSACTSAVLSDHEQGTGDLGFEFVDFWTFVHMLVRTGSTRVPSLMMNISSISFLFSGWLRTRRVRLLVNPFRAWSFWTSACGTSWNLWSTFGTSLTKFRCVSLERSSATNLFLVQHFCFGVVPIPSNHFDQAVCGAWMRAVWWRLKFTKCASFKSNQWVDCVLWPSPFQSVREQSRLHRIHVGDGARLRSSLNSNTSCDETSFGFGPAVHRWSTMVKLVGPSVWYFHVVLQFGIDENSSRMTLEWPHVSYSITSIEAVHKPNRFCTIHQVLGPVNTLFLIGNVASMYLNERLRLLLEEVPSDAREQSSPVQPINICDVRYDTQSSISRKLHCTHVSEPSLTFQSLCVGLLDLVQFCGDVLSLGLSSMCTFAS